MRTGALVALGLALACTEFPNEPVAPVSISPAATWASEIFVQDSDTLEITVALSNAMSVSGLHVDWQSNNVAILRLEPVQARAGGDAVDSLTAQRKAVATGVAGGFAAVRVRIESGGPFQVAESSYTIRVVQKWTSVSAGSGRSCGVTVGGDAYCWGLGPLGDGSAARNPVPVLAIGGLKFRSISTGAGYTCGVLLDRRGFCWGIGTFGTIGNGVSDNAEIPVPIALGRTLQSVAAGSQHACALLATDPWAYCWGDNQSWQLGDAGLEFGNAPQPAFDSCDPSSPRRCSVKPRRVQGRNFQPFAVLAIDAGLTHTCAIQTSGDAICWGSGSAQLGSDTFVRTDSVAAEPFVVVRDGRKFTALGAGDFHTCALNAPDSLAFCWGINPVGQLGTPAPGAACAFQGRLEGCSAIPRQVSGNHPFVQLSVGQQNACGLTTDSTVYCWGANDRGQLGTIGACDADVFRSGCTTPLRVQLPDTSNVISVSVGSGHACAITRRGAAYCWGNAGNGEIGNDSIPVGTTRVGPLRVSEPR